MYPATVTERLGALAGLVVTGILVGLLFVGPWRVFALDAGDVPIRILEATRGSPVPAGAAVTAFVGFVTGCAYPRLVDADAEEFEWDELAMGMVVPPLVSVVLGTLALLLAPAADSLASGAIGDAVLQATVALAFTLVLASLGGTVLVVYVGLPALVGVFAGVHVGKASVPE